MNLERTKRKSAAFLQRYRTALRQHLKQRTTTTLATAYALGAKALAAGLQTLDLARLHERALIDIIASASPQVIDGVYRHAGNFFAEAITPIEKTHKTARQANAYLNRLNDTLSRRAVELTASNRLLRKEIAQRKAAENALRKSERHYSELLQHSRRMQEQLRHLSHRLLSAQEEERKTISRDLHDEIAQILTGVNVQLGALQANTTGNTQELGGKIAQTQRLVEKLVQTVHRFARELRPSVLDDLGLIPALHAYVKGIAERSGLKVHLAVCASVERLDTEKRTVLYRVAQEALTNVVRHADATRVKVCIEEQTNSFRMTVADNGRSFAVQKALKRGKRLGLLGMRERVEMMGGKFGVKSERGKGTVVEAVVERGREE